jgi:hypothetical protein
VRAPPNDEERRPGLNHPVGSVATKGFAMPSLVSKSSFGNRLDDDLDALARTVDLTHQDTEWLEIVLRERGEHAAWTTLQRVNQRLKAVSFDLADASDRAAGLKDDEL